MCIRDSLYAIQDLVEKPAPPKAPSQLAIMGRYIMNPEIFQILSQTEPGAGGEIQLTDALKVLCQQETMHGLVFAGKRYDVGDRMGYLKATVEFALERPDLSQEFTQYLKDLVAKM